LPSILGKALMKNKRGSPCGHREAWCESGFEANTIGTNG